MIMYKVVIKCNYSGYENDEKLITVKIYRSSLVKIFNRIMQYSWMSMKMIEKYRINLLC